jgi:hypothetical protein
MISDILQILIVTSFFPWNPPLNYNLKIPRVLNATVLLPYLWFSAIFASKLLTLENQFSTTIVRKHGVTNSIITPAGLNRFFRIIARFEGEGMSYKPRSMKILNYIQLPIYVLRK